MTRTNSTGQAVRLIRTNTSGYQGVGWHKAAQKWVARIAVGGVQHYLGLFSTVEDAHAVYTRAAREFLGESIPLDPNKVKSALLDTVRALYVAQGISALSTPFLEKQKGRLYHRLLAAGLGQPVLLEELGLTEEYATWRASHRNYRGVTKPKWSWRSAIATAKEIKERDGDLPTVEWCRRNGHSSLASAVFNSGHTWDDLREVVGSLASSTFYPSRNGMRWRSRPEACLSNFLYARGIEHKRGERYPQGYSEQSGRRYGCFDLHFVSATGTWIDVEVWGDPQNSLSGGRYQATRAFKEKWLKGNPNFLGIPYRDCLSDATLTEIFRPYIGIIEPFQFDKPVDHIIQTSHWSNADELLITCKEFAAQMPDGIFPAEDWLRKRGKYKERPGPTYNTLAIRVNQWLGGTRNVREILGHGFASTTAWTPEQVMTAWQDFQQKHGLTPSQCKGAKRRKSVSTEVQTEASRIYEVARRLGVLAEARNGRFERKIRWTPEGTIQAWREFTKRHGRTPSQCMSSAQRRSLPRAVTDEATNIYGAARRLGVLAIARSEEQFPFHYSALRSD